MRNWLNEEKHREKPESTRISELEVELKAEKRRNAELEEAVAIFKKDYSTIRHKRPEITYEFISKYSSEFPVVNMCKVLEVSRSGYYDWENKEPSQRDLENQEILETAQESYNESGGIYGLDKLLKDVRGKFPKKSFKPGLQNRKTKCCLGN